MGVMSCSHRECGNILCDTYISEVGYVCNDCLSEFVLYCEEHDLVNGTDEEFRSELQSFCENGKTVTKEHEKTSVYDWVESYRR